MATEAFQSAQQAHSVHLKANPRMSPDSFLAFSRHVLDDLSPAIIATLDSSEVLIPAVCDEINRVFKALATFSPTPHLLKQTQIHLALESISEADGGWPDALSSRADGLLTKWHDEISELKILEDTVWGEAGALAGCSEILVDNMNGWLVKMKHGKRAHHSHVVGDLGFYPGFWWINRAAAARDGMIDSVCNDITYDRGGVYAVIITGDREAEADFDSIEYDGTGVDGSYRLLATLTHLPNLVRLFREETNISSLAPEFGLRYEGLYRVSKFFSKLEVDEDGSDRWIWKAHFEYDKPKNVGPLRLARPDGNDMMIWKKFVAEREDHVTKLQSMDVVDSLNTDDRQIF